MALFQDNQGKKVSVPKGKTYNGYPVNRWLAQNEWDKINAVGLFEFSPPAPPEPTLEQKREAMIVTPWQFRKAINALDLRGSVNGILNQAGQDVKDAWEVASQFERTHPLIIQFGYALGLDDQGIDDLFELAATL